MPEPQYRYVVDQIYWHIIIFLLILESAHLFIQALVIFMSIVELEEISLTLGIGGLMSMMVFILYKLGNDSDAGKFGTFVIFLALCMGIFGFATRSVITLIVDI